MSSHKKNRIINYKSYVASVFKLIIYFRKVLLAVKTEEITFTSIKSALGIETKILFSALLLCVGRKDCSAKPDRCGGNAILSFHQYFLHHFHPFCCRLFYYMKIMMWRNCRRFFIYDIFRNSGR